ncbi:hypothetical protein [Pseudarthrobacter sp. BIM B-2242]|uniref:hypothetical protein n=1 Tax=Pseudarthrobacter sp. BIM B-2242 TaxID=2772401 RepID=UPI00168BC74B|nr:hypothetical protein [Pseudarthrobacter sp. BIM B-2242]QOD04640.1 hypothetical protein IDT60_06245 [Pseudarthrobacter sp. BIM B-2242]
MNSLFFWIIILSFVIPMAMRMYRKSVNKRNQGQGFSGGYPGQFPGGGLGGDGQNPGQQNRQPRDGYTQQDYMSGGFRQIMSPQPLPPSEPLPPMKPVPPMDQQFPDQRAEAPKAPAAPGTPAPPSAPQGYRARKLAELDQQYSNGELAMEEYMKRRSDIMNG